MTPKSVTKTAVNVMRESMITVNVLRNIAVCLSIGTCITSRTASRKPINAMKMVDTVEKGKL